ncbi:hypothetical protein [Embleya sp. NPDC005575]|uniref:hypothetical protein n=1 Tax=Embleya sp. NPDC005575 TaxID=3156892 RepID=UPI00339DE891
MYETPLDRLERDAILHWALPPEVQEDGEAVHARLKAGDFFSGCADRDGSAIT